MWREIIKRSKLEMLNKSKPEEIVIFAFVVSLVVLFPSIKEICLNAGLKVTENKHQIYI